jgi:hypothetical protein
MSAPARGFWREVVVALGLSLAAAALQPATALLLGPAAAWRLVTVVVAGAYALTLLAALAPRVGRFVMPVAWAVATLALVAFDPPLAVWALVQLVAIWLVRCLYAHDGFVVAVLDAGLSALAVAAGVATLMRTHSLFLAAWAFFLVQALWVLLPRSVAGTAPDAPDAPADTFDAACRSAEAALARLDPRR